MRAHTPTGATIIINNMEQGTTPAVIELKRKKSHLVRLELEGYQPFEATLTHKVSGWVWGNLVFGLLPGLVIDAISGGMYKLTPEQIQGVLQKQDALAPIDEDTLVLAVVMQPEPGWQKVGQLTRLE